MSHNPSGVVFVVNSYSLDMFMYIPFKQMQPVPARLFKGYIAIQLKTSFSLSFCAINSFWLTEKCY